MGNALKTLKGKGRMSPEEYTRVKEEVLKQLGRWYETVRVPPKAVDKLDHGDVDVVCLRRDSDEDAPSIDLILKQHLGSREIVYNTGLTSFEFLGRQIDLKQVCTEQALDFKVVFCSHGVVGTVLALMCKPLGLLINSERLAVSLPPHLSAQHLLLTHDIWQALQFFGLSGDIWKRGFSDWASLCRWFASSRFFNRQALYGLKEAPGALMTS